ncbi:cation diffusion facilitator family transporter [Metabacillus sp. GX 13764]|uniref:cation diffusion facilitator family transporter n=1 Tax=Metabacillus kandeliae TaxID=2900151 RepID=UPI001E419E8D|nr:cation diffusion facilitator family transporter [Metabacillus kandeliae]MCD7035931.1 cation diffusion facilitator family transporter [Metabacillus kandeliae]
MEEQYKGLKLGERGAIISIIAYLVLSALKLVIGYTADSEALRADGLNNTTDIIASVAVLIGLRISQKPADQDHRYGHWKAETVASMVASLIMIGVSFQVIYEAVMSIFHFEKQSPDLMAAWTGIFAAAVMYGVYRYNKRLANQINSQAVMAAAKDNLSDAWVSIGTAVGIIGSQFGIAWLDPVTALIVGLLILKTGWDIFKETFLGLTDAYSQKDIEQYKRTISQVEGVTGVKSIKGRKYGSNSIIDAVILVSPALGIMEAHEISDLVEKELKDKYQIYDVHVHVEPNL